MGILDFREEKETARLIKRALGRRGLKPHFLEEWEVHGKHQDMDYDVYVGFAYSKAKGNICVAIYPRSVYEVEEPGKWWDTKTEKRILTK